MSHTNPAFLTRQALKWIACALPATGSPVFSQPAECLASRKPPVRNVPVHVRNVPVHYMEIPRAACNWSWCGQQTRTRAACAVRQWVPGCLCSPGIRAGPRAFLGNARQTHSAQTRHICQNLELSNARTPKLHNVRVLISIDAST